LEEFPFTVTPTVTQHMQLDLNPNLPIFHCQAAEKQSDWLFYIAGLDFEDERIIMEEFGKRKAAGTFPYGSIPVLELNGTLYGQSNAQLRYAGKLAKLYPTDPVDALKVDELLDAVEDIAGKYFGAVFERDPAKRKELVGQFIGILTNWGTNVEKRLNKFGKGPFAVGDSLTIADLKIATLLDDVANNRIADIPASVIDKFPRLKGVIKGTYSQKKVQEWVAKNQKK